MAIKPVELTINCGYAQAAIREMSVEQRKSGSERAECFTALFESTPDFYNPSILETYGHRESSFVANCKRIVHKFDLWKNREVKHTYLKTFSTTGNYYHDS